MTQHQYPLWSAHIITAFPDMFPSSLGHSLAGKALEQNIWSYHCTSLRDFGVGRHRDVDGPACGGGVGLVMRPDVVGAAIDHVLAQTSPDIVRLYPSPRGRRLDQQRIRELACVKEVMFVCGRYEGIDQRVIDHYQLEEISVGDYVLSGGEVGALSIMDATVRLLDGVMGKAEGHEQDSFENGLLEHPQYTAPRSWREAEVPQILLSGHHGKIAEWKQRQAEEITKHRRPELFERYLAQINTKNTGK